MIFEDIFFANHTLESLIIPVNDNNSNSPSYPQELIDSAREYGHKAANLNYLDKIVAGVLSTLNQIQKL